eukprot:216357-Prymnesium_polylepis.1
MRAASSSEIPLDRAAVAQAPRRLVVHAPPHALAHVRTALVPHHIHQPFGIVDGALALLRVRLVLAHILVARRIVEGALALLLARLPLAHVLAARRKVGGALALLQARLPPPCVHVARRVHHRAHPLPLARGVDLALAHQLPLHHLVAVCVPLQASTRRHI